MPGTFWHFKDDMAGGSGVLRAVWAQIKQKQTNKQIKASTLKAGVLLNLKISKFRRHV